MSDYDINTGHYCDTCSYFQANLMQGKYSCTHTNYIHGTDYYGCADWQPRDSEEPVSSPLE